MTGRPSLYSPELAQEICVRLADGEPLAEICRSDGMPHPSTVRRWASDNEALSLAIADAREDGEERITADIRKTARGEPGYSTGDVIRDKLIIDTDLKLLAKWNPKKYGDKTLHTGADGEAPAVFTLNIDRRDKDV
ncbi:transposase [Phenylobacterium sp.]|uniref:transposase n=1 Tax=Phenylobacterium sp. TaxID=1871053 RepID=UPI00301DB688